MLWLERSRASILQGADAEWIGMPCSCTAWIHCLQPRENYCSSTAPP